MAGYRHSKPDRAKAALAALLVHVAIGAAFLTGLVTQVSRQPPDALQTIDIREPPPPPVIEIEEESRPRDEAGTAGKEAEATPIVAPSPQIEVPAKPPVAAAPVPGQGVAPAAGAAAAGTGTGAGGTGSGLGGGGSGGSGFTPARKITKIPDNEYRRIKALSGMRQGSVGLSIRVGPDGVPSNCRIARTSGNASVDALMCQLTERWIRFRPARDPQGRAVAQDVTWYPDWSPR